MVFSAASISASVSALRATGSALIKPVVGNTTLDTVIAPAEPYLLAASFLLEANLLELAEIALIRAAACISEQDVPKACD